MNIQHGNVYMTIKAIILKIQNNIFNKRGMVVWKAGNYKVQIILGHIFQKMRSGRNLITYFLQSLRTEQVKIGRASCRERV